MTPFFERPVQGPGTHALVIGVGHYPHLMDGKHPDFPGLGALESPALSADLVARWFADEYVNPEAPAASLEILASNPSGNAIEFAAGGHALTLAKPTSANVKAAVRAWARRVHSDAGNIALLYFCGHGIKAGVHHGLLLDDFCDPSMGLYDTNLDIVACVGGMDLFRARRQCFLIDACSTSSDRLKHISANRGIGDPMVDDPAGADTYGDRQLAELNASSADRRAYALPGKPSLFADALLATLRGGASHPHNGAWVTLTSKMKFSLDQHLARRARTPGVPKMFVREGMGSSFALNVLSKPPEVPVLVGCSPASALSLADLSHRRNDIVTPRGERKDEAWLAACVEGDYSFIADVDGKQFIKPEVVRLPLTDVSIEVSGG